MPLLKTVPGNLTSTQETRDVRLVLGLMTMASRMGDLLNQCPSCPKSFKQMLILTLTMSGEDCHGDAFAEWWKQEATGHQVKFTLEI